MAMNSGSASELVLEHYSSIAREYSTSNTAHTKKVAEAFGYTAEDLAIVPDGANLGLSCGNPLAVASIREGETVIDLGSGAGFDVFQAARRVGATGLSIGVDMSQDMLKRARKNASKASITNVKFVLAPITEIPLEDASADCIISNCVINLLTPEQKPVCFAEASRLLKPGGRLAVSDILAKKPLTAALQADMGLYVGCISGASLVGEYENWLKDAGFKDIMIVDKYMDLNIYKERNDEGDSCCETTSEKLEAPAPTSSCCAPAATTCCSSSPPSEPEKKEASKRVADVDFNEWVSSYSIYAVKPEMA